MEILFLGTSGGGITKTRNLPSILIDESILFDCGEGCLKSLREKDIALKDISHIFITHFHADHVLGLISIIYSMAFYERIGKIPPIYIPKGMKRNLMAILDNTFTSTGLNAVGYELDIRELALEHSEPLHITSNTIHYKVDWIKTTHIPICYAYKINNKIVYTGDTAPFNEMILFAQNIKILIHEAAIPDEYQEIAQRTNHSTPMGAATVASQSQVEKLFLFHTPDFTEYSEETYLKNALKKFPNITIVKDGDTIINI